MSILFFFLTDGFRLVPETAMETGIGFSKGPDFAIFIALGMITVDAILKRHYFKVDTLARYLIVFGTFLVVCILNSKYIVGLSWSEVLRSSRFQFLWVLYFVFRNMESKQLKNILDICYYLTLATSVLYVGQLIIGETILNEGAETFTTFLGQRVKRFYNQPYLILFFSFYTLYNNPIKGPWRYVATVVLLITYFGALHRSWNLLFLFAILVGYIINLSKVKKVKIFTIAAIILVPIGMFSGYKFLQSRTFQDVKSVLSGDFLDVDFDLSDLEDATFAFRMGHLVERMEYLSEKPQSQILGAGLITEDSKKTDKMFDFKVGLVDELTENTIQLDTSDISYSLLFIWFGYLGTFLYMMIYFYLFYYFYKKRKNKYAFISFLFLFVSFGVSFFSANFVIAVNYVVLLITYCIVQDEKQIEEPKELHELHE
ncbi:hypothetical protein LJB98_00495 [Bacteroidales bacterium OttesenSCG-928-M11]|nr:hypothetical protein [Bacteroidales bacterium OttesenSCG-928-M11]